MIDPNAYIPGMRRISSGIRARSAILKVLCTATFMTVKELAEATGFSRPKVYYHLKLLEKHSIVGKRGHGRETRWYRTKRGQTVLGQFFTPAMHVS